MTDAQFEAYVPQVRDGFLWEPIPDGCLIFEEGTGKLVTLNAAAEMVLTYCVGEMTVAEICRTVEEECQIPEEKTRAVIESLVDQGIIAPPPAE